MPWILIFLISEANMAPKPSQDRGTGRVTGSQDAQDRQKHVNSQKERGHLKKSVVVGISSQNVDNVGISSQNVNNPEKRSKPGQTLIIRKNGNIPQKKKRDIRKFRQHLQSNANNNNDKNYNYT